MGFFFKFSGAISLLIGIIAFFTIIGIGSGITLTIQGVALMALGEIYDNVKEIRRKL